MSPYDPRHVSKGGNRTTRAKDLVAPKAKFKVVGVDTFDGGDWVDLITTDKKKAIKRAQEIGGTMQKAYVYDEKGNMIANFGTF